MTLSTRLQAKLDAARAERELAASRPAPRRQPHAFTRLHAVGVAFGLLAGGAAFLYGAQTPSNTLPPTPVIVAEPAPSAEPPALTMADLVPAKPVKCNPYASNGVYLPELCGEHDAFAARAARTSRPPATTDAERVKAQALSYAAEQLLARCDRDWLPSTCAQMRAELAGQ